MKIIVCGKYNFSEKTISIYKMYISDNQMLNTI